MRNLLKQFKKGSREIRLTIEEKSVMRQTLVQFARENPIMHTSRARSSRAVVSPYSFMRKAHGFKILSATVIGGILIGGTVSFAAEGALPGNVLYPVKTEVNERVRSVVAVTPQAKADWDIKLVERRLSEVKEVGLLETVPLETKEIARANVKKYTERAQKRIVELDDNEDDEHALLAAENLARVLQEHESMLLEDIHNKKNEMSEENLDDGEDEVVETKQPVAPKREVKEVKRVRITTPTSMRASSTTGSSPVNVKDTTSSRERENNQSENTDNVRIKKSDTESLEKTVDDIREVRENLEKRNKEKKAEYERRKESRKEEEEKDTKDKKDEERKTYISAPSSESER